MVGTLGESSQKKAAYLLSAKDPAAALKGNESGKSPAKEIKVESKQLQQIESNQELMRMLGVNGTPAVLQLDDTGMMQLHPGAPQGEQLLELFGPRP